MLVVSRFLVRLVAAYGTQNFTVSENGTQVASVLFQGVMNMLGLRANFATPSHPQTIAQVKRFNMTIVRQLRHYASEYVKLGDEYNYTLPAAYNSQVHSCTGDAPTSSVTLRRGMSVAVQRCPFTEHTGGRTLSPAESNGECAAGL